MTNAGCSCGVAKERGEGEKEGCQVYQLYKVTSTQHSQLHPIPTSQMLTFAVPTAVSLNLKRYNCQVQCSMRQHACSIPLAPPFLPTVCRLQGPPVAGWLGPRARAMAGYGCSAARGGRRALVGRGAGVVQVERETARGGGRLQGGAKGCRCRCEGCEGVRRGCGERPGRG
jgi:hypothetical protein